MNNIIACIFPDPLPNEDLLCPLVQVFGQLVYLQAVEGAPLGKTSSTPYIEQLLQHKTLQMFTPMPLGEQRERFLALTGDMQNRRDDYTSQLSMLTLAGLSRRGRVESKNSILTSLLKSSDIDSKDEEEELLIWQSRLMLKLGEFFDAEQADLDEALRSITNRQDDLLAELREETDLPISRTVSLHNSSRNADGILQHRLKAWSRLYFHDAPPAHPQVFITRHETVLDTLQEVFEKNQRQSAQQIASLELPARHNPVADSPLLDPLINQCPGVQTALAALTTVETSSPPQVETLMKLFRGCATDWSHGLDTRYPAARYGRCTLDLFLFPEVSSRQLFLESFVGGRLSEDDQHLTTGTGAVVGLLQHTPSRGE